VVAAISAITTYKLTRGMARPGLFNALY
jgi:hypothetical protein